MNNKILTTTGIAIFVFSRLTVKDTLLNTSIEDYNTDQMNILFKTPSQTFWEPGFIYKIGYNIFNFQVGYTRIISFSSGELKFSPNTFYFGCNILLGKQLVKDK